LIVKKLWLLIEREKWGAERELKFLIKVTFSKRLGDLRQMEHNLDVYVL
jgi:hypothetical protein